VCHSPLDKRNRAGRGKGRRSKDEQGGGRSGGNGSGNGRRCTTSTKVLFSSTQFDKVDVKKPA
jgi:hypothetical protein